MTKAKMVKENANGVEKSLVEKAEINAGVELTIEDCYNLAQAIYDLSMSSPSLKGKVIYALSKNEGKLESLLKKTDKKRKETIDKYVKIDKEGNYILTKVSEEDMDKGKRPEYIYKTKDGKEQATKEVEAMFQEKVNMDFYKIWLVDFNNIDVNVQINPKIGLIIKYLVDDTLSPLNLVK